MSAAAAAVALESVSKRYGAKTIIEDLSCTVGKGEIVGFLGPNGAGKTTTMRMIAGFTTATSGRVTVAGYDMSTQNAEAARHIGYLPERPPLYDALDVSAYLRFVARAKGVPRAAIPAELERVTAACRLEAVFRREIYKLSKGYRQRVGLAEALREELMAVDGVRALDIRASAGDTPVLSVECHVDAREGVEAAIARAVANRWALHRLERHQPTLENIFLHYVGEAPAARGAA